MDTAELILALLIAVAALVTIARGIGIAYPIFLVIGGLVLGLVPGIPRIAIEPNLIFLIVLPPLLYIAAYFTPVRSLRANLGTISSLAVGLVFATALTVAVVAHTLIPGLPWSVAIALGAIVAPPDAIAATAIASRLGLPRQILTPYAAFLPAERLGASGVIATVTAGLYLGHRGSRIMGADARLTGRAVWETFAFLLNGFVFIVMGLEVPLLFGTLTPSLAIRLMGIGIAVSIVLVLVRALFIFGTVFLPQMFRGQQDMPWPFACSLVLSWAGMRGVVSLAAALALPTTLPAGGPFPARDALIIVTLTVIVFTLLGQGLSLPWLIRRLHLAADPGLRAEEASARQRLLEAATARIDQLYPVWPGHRPLLDQLRDTYRHRSEHIERQRDPSAADGGDRELIEHREIRRTVIDSEREALMRLRAEGEISDDVLRNLERELDLEERRMDA